jgi:peptide/nickel transport system permease protein
LSHAIGNPVYIVLGQKGTPAQVARLSREYGFDRPILAQYWSYIVGLLHGNLGVDIVTQRSVASEIATYFPATLELVLAAVIIGVAWAVPLGIWSAIHPNGICDRFSQLLVRLGASIPSFWLGLMLAYLFFYVAKILPPPTGQLSIGITPPPRVTGMLVLDSILAGDGPALVSSLEHLVLPAVTLSFTACGPILALTRSALRRSLESDYTLTAQAAGLPKRMIYGRLALKNTVLPVTTLVAMTFGYLLGGTVLVEDVYSWPGIGLYAVQSMQELDYNPILGIVLIAASAYIVVYLVADLISLIVDPRVRGTT